MNDKDKELILQTYLIESKYDSKGACKRTYNALKHEIPNLNSPQQVYYYAVQLSPTSFQDKEIEETDEDSFWIGHLVYLKSSLSKTNLSITKSSKKQELYCWYESKFGFYPLHDKIRNSRLIKYTNDIKLGNRTPFSHHHFINGYFSNPIVKPKLVTYKDKMELKDFLIEQLNPISHEWDEQKKLLSFRGASAKKLMNHIKGN